VDERELGKNAARRLRSSATLTRRRERGDDPVVLRDQSARLLQVAVPIRAEGSVGLRDRSKRPVPCRHEPSAEVVVKIIYRRTKYHFGPENRQEDWRRPTSLSVQSQRGGDRIPGGRPRCQLMKPHSQDW
jgi:hypothetical protein